MPAVGVRNLWIIVLKTYEGGRRVLAEGVADQDVGIGIDYGVYGGRRAHRLISAAGESPRKEPTHQIARLGISHFTVGNHDGDRTVRSELVPKSQLEELSDLTSGRGWGSSERL